MGYNNGNTDAENTTKLSERFGDFLKASKTCGLTTNAGCFSPSSWTEKSSDYYKYLLADGTSLAIYVSAASRWIAFSVDIDGPKKGTSDSGKDRFGFYLSPDGNWSEKLLPDVSTDISENSSYRPSSYPARWVLRNGNMDYLKVKNDGKCPNGKVLDWTTNTSCK